ncbi:hypothetical protein cypCar_00047466, partial [Cyprinus carpio]
LDTQVKPEPSHDAPALDTQVKPEPSHDAAAVDRSGGGAGERQTDTPAAVDLSTKRSSESDSSTAADDNFTWSNTGAPVFGSAAAQTDGEKTRGEAEEEGSDEETPHSDEIHFRPISCLA